MTILAPRIVHTPHKQRWIVTFKYPAGNCNSPDTSITTAGVAIFRAARGMDMVRFTEQEQRQPASLCRGPSALREPWHASCPAQHH